MYYNEVKHLHEQTFISNLILVSLYKSKFLTMGKPDTCLALKSPSFFDSMQDGICMHISLLRVIKLSAFIVVTTLNFSIDLTVSYNYPA